MQAAFVIIFKSLKNQKIHGNLVDSLAKRTSKPGLPIGDIKSLTNFYPYPRIPHRADKK